MDNQVTFHNLSSERYDDSRGWTVNPFRSANICGMAPANVHIVVSKPGAIRGNHIHPRTREWLTVIDGRVRMCWTESAEDGRRARPRSAMVTGPVLIEIGPGIVHSIENCSDRDVYLLAFNDGPEGAVQTISSTELLGVT